MATEMAWSLYRAEHVGKHCHVALRQSEAEVRDPPQDGASPPHACEPEKASSQETPAEVPADFPEQHYSGVLEIRGYLIGVLVLRESYYLGVYIWGPLFS